jgi:hypothetical protein
MKFFSDRDRVGPVMTSTSRLMTLWVLWTTPVSLAMGLLLAFLIREALATQRYSLFQLSYLLGIAAAVLVGYLESRLLARHRTRVRFWTLAAGLGSLASTVLSYYIFGRLLNGAAAPGSMTSSIMSWIGPLVWAVNYGLCSGIAGGLALWGARWSPAWPLWLAGVLLLHICPSLILRMLQAALPLGDNTSFVFLAGSAALHGAISAAGTAWLIDRLIFRPAPA